MVYENIQIQQDNFCIAPLVGTYGTINTINPTSVLQFKNTSGGVTGSYDLSPTLSQYEVIESFIYLGPRNTSILTNGMPFVTLRRTDSTQCIIEKWELNITSSRLDLIDTITKTSNYNDKFDCYSAAVASYRVTLTSSVDVGDGELSVTSTAGMEIGNSIFLGPSSNTSYLNDFEEVTITNILDSSTVTVSGATISGTFPNSVYNSGDQAVCVGNIYLFSELGYQGNTSEGTLFSLDYHTGNIIDSNRSGIYNGVRASTYGKPYHNTISFVKNTELLYVNFEDYEVKKSNRINNVRTDKINIISVEDMDITDTSIYRLQNRTIRRTDGGGVSETVWSEYNFQEDSVFSFTDSITLYADPIGVLGNQETVTIYAVVKDQYGVGLSGKTVTFGKVSGDTIGVWGEVNHEGITDINGIASITYQSGWYDPNVFGDVNEPIVLNAYTDGSNVLTGSIYVWSEITLQLNSKYSLSPDTTGVELVTQKIDELSTFTYGAQIALLSSTVTVECKSKIQFPGGDWVNPGNGPQDAPPSDSTKIIKQIPYFIGDAEFKQLDNEFFSEGTSKQYAEVTNYGRLSQTYVSRHLPAGSNVDTVEISQFRFVSEAIPEPFSEKNNTSTTVWIKLLPYGFDLNQSTLVFKLRELSYVGDTNYIDYVDSDYITVEEFDAGAGLVGLEVLLDLPEEFYNNAFIYIYLEVYDNAVPANKILFDYWFKIIDDYRAPFITNEYPIRGAVDVSVNSNISFDILDLEVGVDINSLEFYINNREKQVNVTSITDGYHVEHINNEGFYYGEPVEISIRVEDDSVNKNTLYDMWRFTCIESEAPMIDLEHLEPKLCSKGHPSRQTYVQFNVYDTWTGLDEDSIKLLVDNVERKITKTPIIYRIK